LTLFGVLAIGILFIDNVAWYTVLSAISGLVLVIVGASVRKPLLCPKCHAPWRIVPSRTPWRGLPRMFKELPGPASKCDACGLRYGCDD